MRALDLAGRWEERIDAQGFFKTFDRPVMIVFGSASPPVAGFIANALAGLLPQADLRPISGATHATLDSHPRHVAGIIGNLCRSPVAASYPKFHGQKRACRQAQSS
jgi:pimeloyl-ACP methyl ester carboxylesterase